MCTPNSNLFPVTFCRKQTFDFWYHKQRVTSPLLIPFSPELLSKGHIWFSLGSFWSFSIYNGKASRERKERDTIKIRKRSRTLWLQRQAPIHYRSSLLHSGARVILRLAGSTCSCMSSLEECWPACYCSAQFSL